MFRLGVLCRVKALSQLVQSFHHFCLEKLQLHIHLLLLIRKLSFKVLDLVGVLLPSSSF